MSNIKAAFENKKAFIGFLTAGDPTFEASLENILALDRAGADLIEIGIPFSDPIAEGAVIQAANVRAIANGMTTDRALELAQRVRCETSTPICFVTYLNPVFKYGYDRFFSRCKEVGVDGLICPDLPFEEKDEAAHIAEKYGVDIISIIAPSDDERIKAIAQQARGFIYLNAGAKLGSDPLSTIDAVRGYTSLPAACICAAENAAYTAARADGAIITVELAMLVEEHAENAAEEIYAYAKKIAQAIHEA